MNCCMNRVAHAGCPLGATGNRAAGAVMTKEEGDVPLLPLRKRTPRRNGASSVAARLLAGASAHEGADDHRGAGHVPADGRDQLIVRQPVAGDMGYRQRIEGEDVVV